MSVRFGQERIHLALEQAVALAGEEPVPFRGLDVVMGKVGKTVCVSPSVIVAVESRGHHHTVRVEGLVNIDLRVVLEDLSILALLEPGAIVDPESEIMNPSLLVAVIPTKHHGPLRLIMMADTHGLRGHERIVIAESLEDIERFPTPLVTGSHVPEDSGPSGVPCDADADHHDIARVDLSSQHDAIAPSYRNGRV